MILKRMSALQRNFFNNNFFLPFCDVLPRFSVHYFNIGIFIYHLFHAVINTRKGGNQLKTVQPSTPSTLVLDDF